MIDTTSDTIPPADQQEAERIRREFSRRAVHLLVKGHRELAADIVRASFVEQADILGLETDSW